MLHLIRVPRDLLPAYRDRQRVRLLRTIRITLLAGAIVAFVFTPWARMHDQSGELPMLELCALMALGLAIAFALTFLQASRTYLEILSLSAYVFVLIVASIILSLLPGGFLFGVGAFLSFTVAATVIAVDLSIGTIVVMAISYVLIPNSAMLIAESPWITVANANWILLSGGMFAFGLALLMDQSNRNSFLLEHALAIEKQRSDALISALLPAGIVKRLQASDEVIADVRPQATVLFADLVGFTQLSKSLAPDELIKLLTSIFTVLDELARKHGLEKIKTIGDSYMVAGGVADAEERGVDSVAAFGLEAIDAVRQFKGPDGRHLDLRVGMATGNVISGVIGRSKPYFDLWGPTVNLASRLQETAPPSAIQIDRSTAGLISIEPALVPVGHVTLRGIGDVETFLLKSQSGGEHLDDRRESVPAEGTLPVEP
jgi:adenylate cyclase